MKRKKKRQYVVVAYALSYTYSSKLCKRVRRWVKVSDDYTTLKDTRKSVVLQRLNACLKMAKNRVSDFIDCKYTIRYI